MIKVLIVVCAVVGAWGLASGFFHFGNTACWVVAAVVGVCGLGLSSKG